MSYVRKSYAYTKDGKQVCFSGHIRRETAIKRGFESVTLSILDMSGHGRGENRRYVGQDFDGMKPYR